MIDDAFVFDGVAHVFNFDQKNPFGKPGEMFSNHLYAFHTVLTPDDQPKLPPEEYLRQWTPSDIRQMVYDESDTDMLVAMPSTPHGPLQGRPVAVGGVRQPGEPGSGPHHLLGFGQPAGRTPGVGPDGAPGR